MLKKIFRILSQKQFRPCAEMEEWAALEFGRSLIKTDLDGRIS